MNVAEDIVTIILLNLPVRSLLRFRCVCKDWCALIESCIFKDNYLALRRAGAVDDQVAGVKVDTYESGICKSFVTCWYDDYKPLALSASDPSSSSNDLEISCNCSGPTTIIDHFDGIVCVQGDYWEEDMRENWFDVSLVNPALRQVRKLPVPQFGEYCGCYLSSVGFGYDDATNDYKVFAIVTVRELGGNPEIVLVYHLSTNSWRKLGFISEFVKHNYFDPATAEFVLSMFRESIFTHGSIHWIMRSDPNCRILTFNLTSELFHEILFPHGWRYYDDTIVPTLFTIDKSTIALVAFAGAYNFTTELEDNGDAQVLDIWVMKEYGDSESWTKQYSINSLPRFRMPLSFWKKDKLHILTMDSRLIWYDLFTGQVYEYEECDPIFGSYDLPNGQQNQLGQSDPISGPLLHWGLWFVTGHESLVSLS